MIPPGRFIGHTTIMRIQLITQIPTQSQTFSYSPGIFTCYFIRAYLTSRQLLHGHSCCRQVTQNKSNGTGTFFSGIGSDDKSLRFIHHSARFCFLGNPAIINSYSWFTVSHHFHSDSTTRCRYVFKQDSLQIQSFGSCLNDIECLCQVTTFHSNNRCTIIGS